MSMLEQLRQDPFTTPSALMEARERFTKQLEDGSIDTRPDTGSELEMRRKMLEAYDFGVKAVLGALVEGRDI